MSVLPPQQRTLRHWWSSGEPWIWLNASAVGFSIATVLGLLGLIAFHGLSHLWPQDVLEIQVQAPAGTQTLLGEHVDTEIVSAAQLREATLDTDATGRTEDAERWLIKTGNRRTNPPDFRWVIVHQIDSVERPPDVVVLERTEWGNAYGRLVNVLENGEIVAAAEQTRSALDRRLARVNTLRDEITSIEQGSINNINYRLEQLRLERRRLELDGAATPDALAAIEARADALQAEYQVIESRLRALYQALNRDALTLALANGSEVVVSLAQVMRLWQPNAMSVRDKLGHYFESLSIFLTEPPREANTEGGIYPAIFGTVMMVLLMSVLVTPFGVVAAVYLREYARQGPFVRLIRIAVNNLAGVPSIVYGVFGLGFFVYFVGGSIDDLFFEAAQPAPTFGTPGLLWASLTLALLTVPVVIVSTEEGLTRIPRAVREGSLALGATKAETLFRVILPMASPSILTGVILAVARAAGEVAPLMLVGVVKLAPTLPVDGNFPFIHLERKFMHLGFHIYDVGFQSPNVEAARPLVYATALLLVLLIIVLNLTAIMLRNRLENRYRSIEG